MSVSKGFVRALAPSALLALVFVSSKVRDANACGGCFHPVGEQAPSVVTDHRMVFKVGTNETVLWDQVRYAGDPREFAWVLPVNVGARVELSRAEWISAVDNATRSSVTGPEIFCNAQPSSTSAGRSGSSSSSSSSSGGGEGCVGGGSGATSIERTDESAGTGGEEGAHFKGNEDVEVVGQTVIGPYQAVTIRSTDGKGVAGWLAENGFSIPTTVKPIIDAYTREKLDFIALRLRPGVGVRAMRPVRIVTPGADRTLPLRMVTAGVGSHVGLTLWVIGEGRYETSNFPAARINFGALAWDGVTSRSNLSDLTKDALASNGGRGWLTEASKRTSTISSTSLSLFDAYNMTCSGLGARKVPCDDKALPPADGVAPPDDDPPPDVNGGDADAGLDAESDASPTDAAPPPRDAGGDPSKCTKTVYGCDGFDDLDVATRGLHPGDIWITRLRADLPVAALATDLVLQASTAQVEEPAAHHTDIFTDPKFDPCRGAGIASGPGASNASPNGTSVNSGCACHVQRASEDGGTYLLIGLTAIAAALVARKKR